MVHEDTFVIEAGLLIEIIKEVKQVVGDRFKAPSTYQMVAVASQI